MLELTQSAAAKKASTEKFYHEVFKVLYAAVVGLPQ
jgi:hypothetical protein